MCSIPKIPQFAYYSIRYFLHSVCLSIRSVFALNSPRLLCLSSNAPLTLRLLYIVHRYNAAEKKQAAVKETVVLLGRNVTRAPLVESREQ